MRPVGGVSNFRNIKAGLPWRNSPGGFEFVSSRGTFQPALTLKMIPVKDMSMPQVSNYDGFDSYLDAFKNKIRKGMSVKAIRIGVHKPKDTDFVEGNITDIKIEHEHKRIRVFVTDNTNNEQIEICPNSIYTNSNLYENKRFIKRFEDFDV